MRNLQSTYYPQPPQPSRNTRRVDLLVLVILVMLIALVILVMLAFLYRFQIAEAMQSLAPHCSVGIQGTAASITVIGLDADSMCQQFEQVQTYYRMPGDPTIAPVVCEGDYQYEHIIVRDIHISQFGNELCRQFGMPSSPP